MQFAFIKSLAARRTLILLACALCAILFAACSSNVKSDTSRTSTPTGTKPPRTALPMPPTTAERNDAGASQNTSFTLLDNRRLQLSDYLGHVVVLDFYATWCPPCREETPHLVEMQKRYGPQGLHVIGLNVGGADDRYAVPKFVEEFKIQYTLGFPDPQMAELYLSDDDRIPQAFVIDRKGRLVKRFISYDSTMPAEMERVVQTALAAGEN